MMCPPLVARIPVACFALMGSLAAVASAVASPIQDVTVSQEKTPSRRIVSIDISSLHEVPARLRLPLPEGGETEFVLRDSEVLPLELAKRYPRIRSMKGVDAKGRLLRLDISSKGIRAAVLDNEGAWFVQPAGVGPGDAVGDDEYLSFRQSSAVASFDSFDPRPMWSRAWARPDLIPGDAANSLRNYRIAIATTSDFAKYAGGTVEDGLALVVETTNRLNAIFERDVGVHLTLATDNDKIIFTDPASDPYIQPSDNDEFDFTRERNIETLNKVIGTEHFDLGHLFELKEEGSAVHAVCQDDEKARATTGVEPMPDEARSVWFERLLGVVLHEVGHQFGADHTFNGCDRDGLATYEPGSGSTLMSYAGGCYLTTSDWPPKINTLHQLQGARDHYFHAKSIESMRTFIAGPGACGTKRSTSGQPPTITVRYAGFVPTIPARTPFSLEGVAWSPRPDALLTYAWEQIDLGPEQLANEPLKDTGQGPIFRSYSPRPSGVRTFPKLEAILGEDELGLGEVYPETTRDLTFRLTVRDNLVDSPSTSFIDRKIRVLDTGRSFAVTHPAGGSTWRGSQMEVVRWDVANTQAAPISCRSVRIELSTDGGHTYLPQPLRASAPNTGIARVRLARVDRDMSSMRVRVSCNDNVFFAVSPGNFTIRK